MITTNLEHYGIYELKMLSELITAMIDQGLPSDFYDDGVIPMFNTRSGAVFLTNSDNDVAMLDRNGDLKSWYFLYEYGNEGFIEDLIEQYYKGDIHSEDYEQLAEICIKNGYNDVATEIQENIKGK